GSVVFEMARQLADAGASVALLALLDAHAPNTFRRRWLPVRLLAHARLMLGLRGQRRREYWRNRMERIWQRLHVAAVGGTKNAESGDSAVVNAVHRVADANGLAWRL